ncbi:MAG: dTDP-4-dehydrorhamnose 3,5-epimerase [Agrobacterium sp.]|uniref:dTDP-4-dehydrorhamnose 3,5-epimerase n=1 Tax=unclassified Agrobacterium TaxID=2632611 RepID=UPI000699BCF2|nr:MULTISPECIES: dTDP-4-dehydrorhamnose 3,5-epimerase [unclassified Agrobacterium]KNY33282.1 dTDP-4-dehydrorhamnose 3,5-epimerase [Agrobacterium sp. SUL3]MCD4661576.1 dTDP-4-dehydrorhamnose 3,5-epimerase [Agrobacterium sp.]
MQFERLDIPDVILITPKKFGDERGYFMESFRKSLFEEAVGNFDFVQDNQSLSADAGTIRGLHFQLEPKAQGKLVSCVTGAILDVAVDIRTGSPTYGHHVTAELTPDNGQMLWVPAGFAHGFCTLEANTKVSYKVTEYYSPEHDRGLAYDDPEIGINWPIASGKAVLSAKDRRQPTLAELGAVFTYSQSSIGSLEG